MNNGTMVLSCTMFVLSVMLFVVGLFTTVDAYDMRSYINMVGVASVGCITSTIWLATIMIITTIKGALKNDNDCS